MKDVFNSLDRFSKVVHLRDEAKNLRQQIGTVGCGDCSHWMYSRLCPREKTIMVTCGMPICGSFIEKQWSVELRQKWQKRLEEITEELKSLEAKP